MANITLVRKTNGTVTNASAAVLRGKKIAVKNGSSVSEVEALLASLGHTVTVKSYFELTPAGQRGLAKSAKSARAKRVKPKKS